MMNDSMHKDELAPTIDMESVSDLDAANASDSVFEADISSTDKIEQPSPWPLKMTVLLVFLLALAFIYLWAQQTDLRKQLQQDQSTSFAADLQKLEQRLVQQDQVYQSTLEQYREQQQWLTDNLESAQGQIQRQADKNLELLQVESVLRLANNRYVLMRDIETSKLAIQQAIKLLADKTRPELVRVREQAQKELASLQSIKQVDVATYLSVLNDMMRDVERLKLIAISNDDEDISSAVPTEKNSAWSVQWKQLLQALKPVLIIRRSAQSPQFVMTNEEERLIRLVLMSRYDFVREALLREDKKMLSVAANSAHDWLVRYFDPEQTRQQSALQVLTELQAIRFDLEYPSIGEALGLLTQFISQPEKNEIVSPSDTTDLDAGERP